MTDQELIKALKHCGDFPQGCGKCPAYDDQNCIANTKRFAADRLEALLVDNEMLKREIKVMEDANDLLIAENEHLREATKMVPQRVSVDERLPEIEGDVLVTVNGKFGGVTYVGGYMLAEYVPGEGWILEEYPELENPDVTYWCELPEPPSTEDSPTGQKG